MPRFPCTKTLRDRFNKIDATLFHLIQFVDLNVKAILRILKKHDKRRSPSHPRAHDTVVLGLHISSKGAANMMDSLRQTQDLDALCVTLQEFYAQLRLKEQEQVQENTSSVSAVEHETKRMPTTRGRSHTIVDETGRTRQ